MPRREWIGAGNINNALRVLRSDPERSRRAVRSSVRFGTPPITAAAPNWRMLCTSSSCFRLMCDNVLYRIVPQVMVSAGQGRKRGEGMMKMVIDGVAYD